MAEEIEDKRRYFRVNDNINLIYKIIDATTFDHLSHVSNEVLKNCSLNSALDVLTQDAKTLFSRLERREPELSEYLKIMDTKINLIAQAVSIQDQHFTEYDSKQVILSATGLAFANEVNIDVGGILELRMLLTSCMAVVVAYARVLQCKNFSHENPAKPYLICVEYVDLKEDVRELLIKHVVKTQLQQLRDKYQN